MTEPTIWEGCYNSGWQGVLTPEAFQHPAKVSRGLARRIYQHAFERSWLKEADVVLDPFGGIGGFAFHALQHGLTWLGIELEQKFVDLGQQNIALWNARYSRMPHWGTAQLLQGDSRRLSEAVREAGICISSPPYAGIAQTGGTKGLKEHGTGLTGGERYFDTYGTHPAQLGNMREGDVDAVVDCTISSPPYSGSRIEPGNVGNEMMQKRWGKGRLENPDKVGYGSTEGQLAAMPTGEPVPLRVGPVDACISSPPWEKAQTGGGISATMRGEGNYKLTTSLPGNLYQPSEHGTSEGQLGQESTTTFWQAAKTIVQQAYQVLKPGGYAIWVVKAFVRNKAIVDFPGQWQRVAEACGFETVEIIHALLTEDRGAQYGLDGELHKKTIKRAGFFRRLHERKYPHLAIDFEIVLCQQKPLE